MGCGLAWQRMNGEGGEWRGDPLFWNVCELLQMACSALFDFEYMLWDNLRPEGRSAVVSELYVNVL